MQEIIHLESKEQQTGDRGFIPVLLLPPAVGLGNGALLDFPF